VEGGRFFAGQLPSEQELMTSHGVPRSVVRAALTMLRAEGLIERTQGVGTHVVAGTVNTPITEAHGVITPTLDSVFNHRMRPHVLDCSVIPLPEIVSQCLGVPTATSCLRLEYVALLESEPTALATNYVLFPEAQRMRDTRFESDWYALLADAGIELGRSQFAIGGAVADPLTAPLLGVRQGSPLISMEQVIADPCGRLFDFALIYTRADRFRFVSRACRTEESP
jgi:GntR family transcriptional regulator